RNTGEKEVEIWVGGDFGALILTLHGPGALNLDVGTDGPTPPPLPKNPSRSVKLGPGESHAERMTRLGTSNETFRRRSYWTEPGEYTLTATYQLAAGKEKPNGVKLTSAPIKLKIEAK